MKIQLELNVASKDDVFLNFWNSWDGDDVVCEVHGDKLFLNDKEISLSDFIKRIVRRVRKHA